MSVRLPWGIVGVCVADVTTADIMCSGGARSVIGLRSAAHLGTRPDQTASWYSRGLVFEMLAEDRRVF